jgi:sodium/potassium-transporting ATPase subunit alpha
MQKFEAYTLTFVDTIRIPYTAAPGAAEKQQLPVPADPQRRERGATQKYTGRNLSTLAAGAAAGARPEQRIGGPPGEVVAVGSSIKDDAHVVPIAELLARLGTAAGTGLSRGEARSRLARDGRNELSPVHRTPLWVLWARQMTGLFPLLLWASAALCLVAYGLDTALRENLYLGLVLIAVVATTGTFAFYVDARSRGIVDAFSQLVPTVVTVVRDGAELVVPAGEVVVGDVVRVQSGSKVPADIRILESDEMKVDNSALTGEVEPQARATECTNANPLETRNLAFFGTLCVEGRGTGVVVRCGDSTAVGRIAKLATRAKEHVAAPLQAEIDKFIKVIALVAFVLGVSFLILDVLLRPNVPNLWITNIVFMIGIIIGNVPEGLLATVTVSLALTARKMASRQVVVKALDAIETLGSTTVIASDKTGTLTQNRMTVRHLWISDATFSCATTTEGAGRDDTFDLSSGAFRDLLRVAVLCNKALFDTSQSSAEDGAIDNMSLPVLRRKTIGDASESALLKFAEPLCATGSAGKDLAGPGAVAVRERYRKVFEIPFNSTNKFQISVHAGALSASPKQLLLVIKGAPERIIDRCSRITTADGGGGGGGGVSGGVVSGGGASGGTTAATVPLDSARRIGFEAAYEALGSLGERVLACAFAPLDPKLFSANDSTRLTAEQVLAAAAKDLIFAGMFALIDPPRETVPQSVLNCQAAGIKVIMVTGDHPHTAAAIARNVNIIRHPTVDEIAAERGVQPEDVPETDVHAVVVAGSEIPGLTFGDWNRILAKESIVFARTSPEQKLDIVAHCQARGEIVAVTGDGVNDSPALNKADVGIAMGIVGSDVAKDAASVILLDDNFSSIVHGVEEGRIICDNLKKSIAYTLASTVPQIAPFLCGVIFNIPTPLSTILIIWIHLGTDLVPAIALAYERGEQGIMARPPRDPKRERLVSRKLISFSYLQIGIAQALAGFFAYLVVLTDYGFPPSVLPGNGATWGSAAGNPNVAADTLTACAFPGSAVCFDEAEALRHARTAYFIAILAVQIACLLASRTRVAPLFSRAFFTNRQLLAGVVFETCVTAAVVYVPACNTAFDTRPVRFAHWLPGLPFLGLITAGDQARKWCVRRGGRAGIWLERFTVW